MIVVLIALIASVFAKNGGRGGDTSCTSNDFSVRGARRVTRGVRRKGVGSWEDDEVSDSEEDSRSAEDRVVGVGGGGVGTGNIAICINN